MSLTISEERKAELTLIGVIIDLPEDEKLKFLLSLGISIEEYNQLKEKYKHILNLYNEAKIKGLL
jgi:hypothetical protein